MKLKSEIRSFAGASATMYPYLGELLTNPTRSKLMIQIGYALGIGMILMSLVGWTLHNYFPVIQLTQWALESANYCSPRPGNGQCVALLSSSGKSQVPRFHRGYQGSTGGDEEDS